MKKLKVKITEQCTYKQSKDNKRTTRYDDFVENIPNEIPSTYFQKLRNGHENVHHYRNMKRSIIEDYENDGRVPELTTKPYMKEDYDLYLERVYLSFEYHEV